MKTNNTFYAKNRKTWRLWLGKHYKSEAEIWLVLYKKGSGKPSVSYIDAVEEALCFGWIDGQMKSLGEEKYIQRFTPRKSSSNWSETNIARVKKLIKERKMTAHGLKIYKEGVKVNRIVPSSKNFSVPNDLKKALATNKKAMSNFQNFAPSSQLAFVYWVDSAKTRETRGKRIEKAVEFAEAGKKLS